MRRFDVLVLSILAAILMAAIAFVALRTVQSAERIILPALHAKAEVSARSIGGLITAAHDYGMTLDDMVGVDDVLRTTLAENPQYGALAVMSPGGVPKALVTREPPADPTVAVMPKDMSLSSSAVQAPDGRAIATVLVGIPDTVAADLMRDLWLDIGVVLLASILVTLEVLTFVFGLDAGAAVRAFGHRLDALRGGDLSRHADAGGTGGLARAIAAVDERVAWVRARHETLRLKAEREGDEATLAELDALNNRFRIMAERPDPSPVMRRVRMPLFLFFLAEEMTRPFLPGFTAHLTEGMTAISHELAISLPIVLFMAIVALSQPWLGGLTERFGRSRAMRLGAAIAVAGFVGTAYSTGFVPLLVFRSLVAIGYAAVFVGAQGVIIDNTTGGNRARGLALLVTAIMVAALCGPPIGGIIADRLGPRAAFLVCGAVAFAAFLCARLTLPKDRIHPDARVAGVGLRQIGAVLRRPAMAALLVGSAFPAKLVLAGLSFFLIPVVLGSGGFDEAAIGRVLMLYALSMLVLVPLVAGWSDKGGRRPLFVVAGGLLAASAVIHPLIWPEPWGAAILVLQLGLGQALSITPQSALVGELGRRFAPDLSEGTLYGVFRLVERLGSAAGPALAAWLLASYGVTVAFGVIGAVVAVGSLAFAAAIVAERATGMAGGGRGGSGGTKTGAVGKTGAGGRSMERAGR